MTKSRPSLKAMNMLKRLRSKRAEKNAPKAKFDSYWNGEAALDLDERDDGHYIQIGRIDSWRSAPFQSAPRPQPGETRQTVRQLLEALGPDAIDEGTGAALDLLIDAWTQAWIHGANMQAIDDASVIDVHHSQAMKFAISTDVDLEHAKAALEQSEKDYQRFRDTLAGTEAK